MTLGPPGSPRLSLYSVSYPSLHHCLQVPSISPCPGRSFVDRRGKPLGGIIPPTKKAPKYEDKAPGWGHHQRKQGACWERLRVGVCGKPKGFPLLVLPVPLPGSFPMFFIQKFEFLPLYTHTDTHAIFFPSSSF